MVDYAALAKKFGATTTDNPVAGSVDASQASQPGTQGPIDYNQIADQIRNSSSDLSTTTPDQTAPPQSIGQKILGDVAAVGRVLAPLGESVGSALAAPQAKAMEADTSARQSQLADATARIIRNPNLSAVAKKHALDALQASQGANVIQSSGAFNETSLQTVGKALGTAGAFLGGEGAAAADTLGLTGIKAMAAKALAEGAIGAGTIGAGTALAQGKTGADVGKSAAGIGILSAAIPLIGEIVGRAVPEIARGLEKSNLRLTPVQKTELLTKINGVTDWIRSNNIIGNPESRFEQVSKINNDLEKTYQEFLKTDASNITVPKEQLLGQLDSATSDLTKFDPRDTFAIRKQMDEIKTTINELHPGDTIPVTDLNQFKRSTYKNAYNKAGAKVIDDVEHAAADVMRQNLESATQGLTIDGKPMAQFNQDYGNAIMAKKLLKTAMGRPQIGLVGRLIAGGVGTTVGGALGAPFGGPLGGFIGTAAGGAAGGAFANAVAGTVPRSLASAALTTAEKAAKPIGAALKAGGAPTVVQALKSGLLAKLGGGYTPAGP